MANIKLACETYTWQMPGEMYKGKLDQIMETISKAGFTGIEPETSFFGELSDPVLMKETLDKHNLELAALCHVEDWLHPKETDEEKSTCRSMDQLFVPFSEYYISAGPNARTRPNKFGGKTEKFAFLCECFGRESFRQRN